MWNRRQCKKEGNRYHWEGEVSIEKEGLSAKVHFIRGVPTFAK